MPKISNQSSLEGKCVVIFGAGYVGSRLVKAAVEAGADVTALTRNIETGAILKQMGCRVVIGDLSVDKWHDAVPPGDLVLNAVGSGGGGLAGYVTSYREGMSSICRWAERHGCVGHLVYTSSTSVYPQGDDGIVTEASVTTPTNERAEILLAAEETALAWPAEATVLRLAGIYGPGRHHLLNQLLGSPSPVVSGRSADRLNLIHRDDVVSAAVACWSQPERSAGEIFNLSDGEPGTRAELMAWLGARLGRPTPEFSGQPASGRRRLTPSRIISNSKITSVLGWAPTYRSFRDGYADILSRLPEG